MNWISIISKKKFVRLKMKKFVRSSKRTRRRLKNRKFSMTMMTEEPRARVMSCLMK